MTYAECKKAIKANGASGGYFLYGDEDYLKYDMLEIIRKDVMKTCPAGMEDFNRSVFVRVEDGNFSEIESAILTPPMIAEKKIVELVPPDFSEIFKDEKHKKPYQEKFLKTVQALGSSPETVFVVIAIAGTFDAGTPKKPSADFNAYAKVFTMVECPIQSGTALKTWVARHLKADGLEATPEVCDLILSHCPNDMLTLSRELDKVIGYEKFNHRTAVTAEDVLQVVSPLREEEDFALSNAVVEGNRQAALEVINLRRKRKDNASATLASLNKVLCDMLCTAKLMEEGKGQTEIATALGLHPFVAGRYMRSAKEFTAPRIAATLSRLRDADRSAKTDNLNASGGGFMEWIPLERFLCTIPLGTQFKRK